MSIIKLFRSRANKQQQFENLLRPHVEILHRMAWRWTQSETQADDLVQDVLVKLVSRVEEMEQVDSLRPWLLRILYHRYVDAYRRSRNSPIDESASGWNPNEDAANDPVTLAIDHHDPIAQLELQRSLLAALQKLDDDQRDVVLLHDMEGYTAEEVAAIMQTSVGTVKSRLHRARNKLKLLL